MTEVTVLICTREILQSMTLQAITAAKANTKVPFDLVVLETRDFTHPRDINKVLKFVKTKYFVTMDDDVLPEKNWLEEMIKVAESDVRIGAVQANIRTPEGIIFIWHGEANPYSKEPTKVEEIGFACTALALFKTKIIREVGYFDENFYKWSFDTDYSWRIKEKGYKVVVAPKAKAIHYASYNFDAAGRRKYFWIHNFITSDRMDRLWRICCLSFIVLPQEIRSHEWVRVIEGEGKRE